MASAPTPDIVVPNSPADTVSSLHFAPRPATSTDADYLVATAWDGSVSVYEVSANGQCLPRAKSAHAAPVLCSAWSADGSAVISGGCDNSVRLWNVATNQLLPVGTHEAPVRAVFDLSAADAHCPQICSGSWDKTVKYWDVRALGPAAASVALSDRVYAMDVKGHVAAIACAERQIHIIDLRKPQEILKSFPSPLKFQSRSITIFPDQSGIALGSIEVRDDHTRAGRARGDTNERAKRSARSWKEIAGAGFACIVAGCFEQICGALTPFPSRLLLVTLLCWVVCAGRVVWPSLIWPTRSRVPMASRLRLSIPEISRSSVSQRCGIAMPGHPSRVCGALGALRCPVAHPVLSSPCLSRSFPVRALPFLPLL